MTTEQMEEHARGNLFPTADELRKSRFNLEAWLTASRSKIESDLKRRGQSVVENLVDDDQRRQVRQFFQSRGYKVEPGTHMGEADGSLIIILP